MIQYEAHTCDTIARFLITSRATYQYCSARLYMEDSRFSTFELGGQLLSWPATPHTRPRARTGLACAPLLLPSVCPRTWQSSNGSRRGLFPRENKDEEYRFGPDSIRLLPYDAVVPDT
jgi:hypothetical protein